jgi:hypothetical protein
MRFDASLAVPRSHGARTEVEAPRPPKGWLRIYAITQPDGGVSPDTDSLAFASAAPNVNDVQESQSVLRIQLPPANVLDAPVRLATLFTRIRLASGFRVPRLFASPVGARESRPRPSGVRPCV